MIDCSECTNHKGLPAACCQDVTITLGEGHNENLSWWSELRWMCAHNNVSVARERESGSWAVIFETKCEKLADDGSCSIYETRPKICADYSAHNCIINGEGELYDLTFDNMDDFDDFFRAEILPDIEEDNKQEQLAIKESLKELRQTKRQINKWPLKA
jgi:uncharacterized protein